MKRLLLALACFVAAAPSQPAEGFDYYMLTMSWAPDFCALPNGHKDARECGRGRQTGFVVHGLWPQGEQGRGPERCGHVSPVARRIVQAMLNYFPTESLVQHEWTDHGSCTGLSAADYFDQVKRARDSVQLPNEFKAPQQPLDLSAQDIESKFAASNPRFPPDAFRTSCVSGALQEVRVCFAKDLSPRACGPSAGECRTRQMLVRPVQ